MKRPLLALALGLLSLALARGDVAFDRILRADREPQSWLTYSGDYRSWRFSTLSEINAKTVAGLRPAWVYQTAPSDYSESTPLVADGVMYLVEAPTQVTALDVHTGRRYWSWTAHFPPDLKTPWFPAANRGVALLGNRVFVGTLDAHLVALDAATGTVRWNVQVAENKDGYGITTAPLAIGGKILIGVSGGDGGIRGFLDAYDADTGKRVWRFWTIPAPGEPGHETWPPGDSWKTGAGATWLSGSYDPELNLVYWGVGNPGPDFNGDTRPGANLFTCSLIALDADRGTLKWYFQFSPHDTHDWDANQIPVLVDAPVGGQMRKLVATANRNGFYYVLDRTNGEFIAGAPFSHLTWANGLDSHGHALAHPGIEPSEKGTLVSPGLHGAASWPSPTYDPQTGLFYVPARETASTYYKRDDDAYKPGTIYAGGGHKETSGDATSGAVRALELTTGKLKWEFPLHSPPWCGLLSTAGGLVFGGDDEGDFFALDAATGKPLWHFQTGGAIHASPMSYQDGGHQYVAIAANNALFVFTLPPASP